ncbi:hypothetical protein BDY19DRAFT_431800 [Irpex rosettiformis]|uniref:Uncharacterized protein n=1 Tax=Irpex rosettiformis TaxID=378272 RepID=A0ACB8TUD1_9APHY|nr:hypothetical protein BDY19DRAFT_431800 [Irpex rosettiformis]
MRRSKSKNDLIAPLTEEEIYAPRNHIQCSVCGDDVHEAYCAPCGHSFDNACLEDMFRRATYDESLYPPRCCQQRISISNVRHLLNPPVASLFDRKASEYETRDRVYCHIPKCSAFLGAGTSEPCLIYCHLCPPGSATCGMCKAGAHPGRKCSATQELNQLATDMHQQQGWQRCYSCGHLVDKTDGCHHITCVCHAQFCYLCAAEWKTCTCPRFDVPPE